MLDVIEVLGAAAILSAFAALQLKRLAPDSPLYLVLNLAGSGVLTVAALQRGSWGFVMLEAAWAVASLAGLVTSLRRPRPAAAGQTDTQGR
ncbi:MAG TPA: hypothetical protein VNE62_00830 [Actinomycetota bacterium]|nr:hypothetical protein [Actinomycetota bacterium]